MRMIDMKGVSIRCQRVVVVGCKGVSDRSWTESIEKCISVQITRAVSLFIRHVMMMMMMTVGVDI